MRLRPPEPGPPGDAICIVHESCNPPNRTAPGRSGARGLTSELAGARSPRFMSLDRTPSVDRSVVSDSLEPRATTGLTRRRFFTSVGLVAAGALLPLVGRARAPRARRLESGR